MSIGVILWLLFVHWIADFVFQTNKMALNKFKSTYWLAIHTLVYSVVLYFGLIIGSCFELFWLWILNKGLEVTPDIEMLSTGGWPFHFEYLIPYVIVNMGLHFFTDAVTSRISAYFWRTEQRRNFFITIGFDQFIHYSCLILTCLMYAPNYYRFF